MAHQTEAKITIAAPAAEVMAVIADIEAYPTWNEEIKEVEIRSVYDDADERPAEVHFVLDAGIIKDAYTLSYDWDGEQSVSWTMSEPGAMTTALDGSYLLSDNGAGSTEVTYRLLVDVKLPMIGMMKRKTEKVIVERALKGLKKRVEA